MGGKSNSILSEIYLTNRFEYLCGKLWRKWNKSLFHGCKELYHSPFFGVVRKTANKNYYKCDFCKAFIKPTDVIKLMVELKHIKIRKNSLDHRD